ncbi:hypothetical protein Tco_0177919 [Tanacetum coccineum]
MNSFSVMSSDDVKNVTSKKHMRSKEDDVLNISKSVYVTNFPDSTSARDLWKEFDAWVPDFEDDDDSLSSGEDAPIFNNDNRKTVKFFHSWFSLDGFDAFVENTWNSLMVSDDNALIRLQRKLQLLKIL